MNYLVMVSHGEFAYGLHNALEMFAGEGNETLISCCLEKGMDVDVFAGQLKQKLEVIDKEQNGIVLLGDLQGGSPLTYAMNVISEMGILEKTPVYSGMNLPLALNVLLQKDITPFEEADAVFLEGANVYRVVLEKADDSEEDDI